ncbi:hypothetical protein H4219_004873 [Mycoemilia scoparia]|uniref:Uncharacterized protein n=1 Tax=Mycoemilia scoparia TaxID=417184 RepID=A0A9W7ZQ56_9FUNG|nr:hypothetical protein H4219_004873 [Mycoemilia scoparia]
MVMIGATNHRQAGNGVAWNVNIHFRKASFTTTVMAIENFKYDLLLGLPFLEQADWTVCKLPNGKRVYRISNSNQMIYFKTTYNKNYQDVNVIEILDKNIPDGYYHVNLVTHEYLLHCDAAKYKPVGKKVHPVNVPLPEEHQLKIPTPERVESEN